VSNDELRPAYLLLGTDRPKIRRALARLRGHFPAESVELLDADMSTGADAVASVNALGLFGDDGARLVVVEGVERWREDDVEAVVAHLGAPAGTSVLALVAEGTLKQAALVDACEKAGQVLRFDVPKPRDPSVWVRAEFERLGVRADADAARALTEIVGDDVAELAEEIEKIATWAGTEPVGRREVELLAVAAGDVYPWTLTDAWGARDVAAALDACESLLESKEPFGIAAALAGYVGRVRVAQALAEEGLGTAEVAKRLRIKDYPAKKLVSYAKNYSPDELDAAIVRLARLDADLKGQSRVSAELQLERALVEVTASAAPAAAS
jgi:DNA polymerase III subunit delta